MGRLVSTATPLRETMATVIEALKHVNKLVILPTARLIIWHMVISVVSYA